MTKFWGWFRKLLEKFTGIATDVDRRSFSRYFLCCLFTSMFFLYYVLLCSLSSSSTLVKDKSDAIFGKWVAPTWKRIHTFSISIQIHSDELIRVGQMIVSDAQLDDVVLIILMTWLHSNKSCLIKKIHCGPYQLLQIILI